MTLGEFVRQRRYRLGLNQGEVSARMGNREKNWISQIENGKIVNLPDPDTVTRLAKALQCSEAELIRAAGYMPDSDESADSTDPDQEFWAAYGDLLTDEEWETLEQIADQFMRSRGIKP